ncbi:acylphosphatase [Corynebacterium sp. 13CS0277]|uniref:acylphosphatase n=1 Tax=Corynebacterium sp. 13CS0277 TaxID=2071994 RepID=UPI000D0268DC|nr:acylphosphatase [Corynebacterium sp. 13CS0277]PRQ12535.1 acylphosphatase [Corynebacterium sp. 13CS0277]
MSPNGTHDSVHPDTPRRMTAFVHGQVQGVGFRWWTRSQALELGLAGSATNLPDRRVCVVVEGGDFAVREMLGRLQEQPSRCGRPGTVRTVVEQWGAPRGVQGFDMR